MMNDDGIPLAHYTFAGNNADRKTVIEEVDDSRTRVCVADVVLVADERMTSSLNFGWLEEAGVSFIFGELCRIRAQVFISFLALQLTVFF
ncbi:hypothetical protein K8I28_14420 [bacterium]|nr:hypothetical protein [bacterium]